MSQADGSIIIDTKIDQSGFSSGLNTMKNVAVKGALAVTAAIGAASVAIVKMGSDFEQANAKASTLFGDAQVDMSQYQGKMLELSSKTGLAATDLGNTMYDALSAGIPASDDMSESLGFLEKNTKLAKAGFTDINTATTATAKVLNAYGMDVSETDRVHKVLMQTQNKGITTVNELGSVLSQVTPTASAMNVSFEQVGAALANMTAQGTPAAQATTQLNQLFAELGKSGTTGQKAMLAAAEGTKYAGKSFQDLMKDGVPLSEVINLMSDYADKNGLSMVDMFSSIESGKAALAVSGDNAQQYTDNLKAMSTQTDVVGEAYDKVTDTFQEKSAKVVNSLKNVGIAAYSKFEKPLKKSMDVAQDSVDSLSREMSSGKLGKSIDKIAEGFGSLIEVTAKLASKVIPLVVNGFSLLIDNGESLMVAFAGVSAAMVYYKNQTLIANSVEAVSAGLKTGLTVATLAYEAAQVALSSGLGIVAAAQAAFNTVMTLCPLNWAVIAVGALAAGIAALCFSMGGENEELKKQNAELDELKKEQDERISQNDKLRQQYDEQMSADLGQVENTKKLADELKGLVDVNGKVKSGYESRAAFILEQLNGAMGTEYNMVGNMIEGYNELAGSIDNMLVKMKTEAILKTQKEQYDAAITNQDEYADNVAKSEEKLNTTKQESNARIAELEAEKAEIVEQYGQKYASQYDNEIFQQQNKIDKAQELYDKDKTQLEKCLADKALFEENWQLAQEGRDDEIRTKNQANLETDSISILTAYQSRYDQLSAQRDAYIANKNTKDAEQTQKEMDDLINEGLAKAAQQGINNDEDLNALGGFITSKQQKLAEMYITDKSKWTESQQQEAADLQASISSGLSTYESYVQSKISKAQELTGKLNANSSKEEKDAAESARRQAYNTLGIYSQNVNDKVSKANFLQQELDKGNKNVTQDMVTEAQNQAKKAIEEYDKVASNTIESLNSKEAESAGIGANYTRGFKSGIESLADQVSTSASWIGGLALSALKTTGLVKSPSKKTKETGKFYGKGFALGIEDEQEDVIDASSKLGKAAIKTIENVSIDANDLFDNADLSESFDMVNDAIQAEQMKMAAVVDTQAKIEILKKTSVEKKPEGIKYEINQTITSPEPLSPSEMSEQTEAMLRRLEWNL